ARQVATIGRDPTASRERRGHAQSRRVRLSRALVGEAWSAWSCRRRLALRARPFAQLAQIEQDARTDFERWHAVISTPLRRREGGRGLADDRRGPLGRMQVREGIDRRRAHEKPPALDTGGWVVSRSATLPRAPVANSRAEQARAGYELSSFD